MSFMDNQRFLMKIGFLFFILFVVIDTAIGMSMVDGVVFCDQCKDGGVTLFDYPLNGAKVAMMCPGGDGGGSQMSVIAEETTNMFGSYSIRFDGNPDLSNCIAQITNSGGGSGCKVTPGPAKPIKLMLSMFGTDMYQADVLVSQPAQPMSMCSNTGRRSSPRTPIPPVIVQPPPSSPTPIGGGGATPPPTVPPADPVTPAPHLTPRTPGRSPRSPTPSLSLPPLPPMPPMPFLEPSACSHEYWTNPDYSCYWTAIKPDMKVAIIFGPAAAEKYGTNMTLSTALQGRSDVYRTLLREATTSLLNAYHSIEFPYNAVDVVAKTGLALMPPTTTKSILRLAMDYRKANSGAGNSACKFKACK